MFEVRPGWFDPLLGAAAGLLLYILDTWFDLHEAWYSMLVFVIVGALIGLVAQGTIRRLHLQTQTDPLTGIWNRRYFFNVLLKKISEATRMQRPLSLLIVDLDDFKQYNDRYGHLVGDRALQAVAERLLGSVRQEDIVARWGGEEFAVILPDADRNLARKIAERLRAAVGSMPVTIDKHQLHITVSVGASTLRVPGETVESLLQRADDAMYRAKSRKNSIVTAEEPWLVEG